MAGLIKSEDVVLVKERASIEDVVREHVTLRPAGTGSLKGLCPFHDEKTPSFTVRPVLGTYHCFGCGKGGDVISFVQEVEHLTFAESVERLAGSLGMELHYEAGSGPPKESLGRRQRLVEANRVAAELYEQTLVEAPEARAGRDFLRARGFDRTAAATFGVGFAPRTGAAVVKHLRDKGFGDEEIVQAGLAGRGHRGLYDRFRGRLIWPIRDITGDVVGFGARRLYDDDRIEAKYLNTAETSLYKKASVLYGLDLAKKAIADRRQAVVVEGYTDVMAAHLAGVPTAVATCGTAFGAEHIKTLRRILRDESGGRPARTIFTFDGDAAGQQAAMRAFELDEGWASQSFVAVAPGGQDPCELRLADGDSAVQELVEDAVPMFEFAARTTLARFDLTAPEGRAQALRAVAPIVSGIRDSTLGSQYRRTVAGWIGVDEKDLSAEITRAASRPARRGPAEGAERAGRPVQYHVGGDPVLAAERQLLQVTLQYPALVDADRLDAIGVDGLSAPTHRAVYAAIVAAGGAAAAAGMSAAGWVDCVRSATAESVQGLVSELAVAPLPALLSPDTGSPERRYVDGLLTRVQEVSLRFQISEAMSALRRSASEAPAVGRQLGVRLQDLQRRLATLQDGMS